MKFLKPPKKISKRYVFMRKHNKARLKKHPYIIPVLALVLSVVAACVVTIFSGGQTLGPSDTRIVTLYADGKEQTIATRAKTVGELMEKMQLGLIAQDLVEPKISTPIEEDNIKINVYRARPVTIIDGEKEVSTLTPHTNPRLAALRAGVKVYPEDKASFKPGDIDKGIVGEQVVIDRATQVSINLYGTPEGFRTRADTVEALLKEKNITLQPGDTVQPALNSPVSSNLQVFLTHFGKQIVTQSEETPMPIVYVDDPTLELGRKIVQVAGSPGKKAVTYEVETKNGKEIARRMIQEIIVEVPATQTVARGTRVVVPQYVGDAAGMMAAAGIRSSDYAYVDYIISHESHWRLDARNPSGCAGLGQACPGSKLAAVCPNWQTDGVCQLRFFAGYASRYGGWGGAYQFWIINHWW